MPMDAAPNDGVLASLGDDLNTPGVLTHLHALSNEIRGPASGLHQIQLKKQLKLSGALLGILITTKLEYLGKGPGSFLIDASKVDALIAARAEARKTKNFAESDRIRDELAAMRVVLKDNKDGTTTWEVKR